MISAMRRLLASVLVILILPRPAAAQNPHPIDLAAGTSIIRDAKNDVNLPRGWYVSGAWTVKKPVSAVFEVSDNSRTLTFLGAEARVSVLAVMAGARLTGRLGKVRQYGQVLVGRASGNGSQFSLATDTVNNTPDSISPHLVVQPGIGLDFPLHRRFALRMELDARTLSKAGNGNENGVQFRLAAGLAYALRR